MLVAGARYDDPCNYTSLIRPLAQIEGFTMGKAIVVGLVVVIIAAMILIAVVYLRHRKSKETALERGWATKGDLNRGQEKKLLATLDSAADLFHALLVDPPNFSGDFTYIKESDRDKIQGWLVDYQLSISTETRKVIERS